MDHLLFLIPFIPLVSALILGLDRGLFGRRLSKSSVDFIGCGSVGISTLICIFISAAFLSAPPQAHAYTQSLWTWMRIGDFQPEISWRFDALSLVMCLVVSFVSFLIHVYSTEFMQDEEGYSRFFSYMNLFVASMLTLVLSDNLLFLYVGWEGVGLCSYLLIGFWYKDPANGRAARKAFIVTRIGDTALAIGLFLIFLNLGTFNIQTLLARASQHWPLNSGLAVAASALLLGGAVGKSAQLPLQTWLPDAMAGPTPVSALIHAATMVTAGVYLIARTHTLFELAPPVQLTVAIVGAVTLIISAFSALTQTDIKRVLAYSTISQIGYMFLALGVGAWSAAIFHFMTHAFFKALLFLGAGAVILSLHHEHNIFKMGGLRKKMPLVFWTFLIGAASLSALPLVTAGFYSKDLILTETFSSPISSKWLWAAGLLGALLTSLYSFRLVFIVFFGEERTRVTGRLGVPVTLPLVALAGLSLLSGFVEIPTFLGNKPFFSDFLSPVFTRPAELSALIVPEASPWVPTIASLVSVIGIAAAFVFYIGAPQTLGRFAERLAPIRAYFYSGWGFDFLYDLILVRPFAFIARLNRNDFIDHFFSFVAWVNMTFNRLLSLSQTGKLRWYAAVIGTGAAVLIVLVEVL